MKSLLIAVPLFLAGAVLAAPETESLYLSGRGKDDAVLWDFYCTTGRLAGVWTNIAVPSCWEQQGFGAYGYQVDPLKESGKYRRTFVVPAEWQGRVVRLVFEGAMTDASVWVNGQSAGPKHHGGFYRFAHDISALVKFGQTNLLEVTVDKYSEVEGVNAAERRGDYWNFGGIFRPVHLEALPPQHIERVAIDAQADGTFVMEVFLGGKAGPADLVTAQIAGLGEAVGEPVRPGRPSVTIRTKVADQKNWTAETPDLYTVQVALEAKGRVLHRISQRFGFRTVEVRQGDGIYVNGARVILKGSNRHSFWPESGRTLSEQISRDDIALMKAMNANAVRMSHYPPDVHFLDACDEMGLYVLDELAGWQHSYDTASGIRLVEAMVKRDVNHPSILFWDNGNEGGWNTDLDGEFAKWDPQRRAVLHPWALHDGVETAHYRPYDEVMRACAGTNIYMPTEFLHGLYDGGAGAGLDDYWNVISRSPVGGGGFIWAFVDEGVVRTDENGRIDPHGNRGPDGIVGPHREIEGSFMTIREIWSPVNFPATALPTNFDGRLDVENRYDFTDLEQCTITWNYVQFPPPDLGAAQLRIIASNTVAGLSCPPQGRAVVQVPPRQDHPEADALVVVARDAAGRALCERAWRFRSAAEIGARTISLPGRQDAEAREDGSNLRVNIGGAVYHFDLRSGKLVSFLGRGAVDAPGGTPNLVAGAKRAVTVEEKGKKKKTFVFEDRAGTSTPVKVEYRVGGDFVRIDAVYTGTLRRLSWTAQSGGWLKCEYEYALEGEFEIAGLNFAIPEAGITGVRWLGDGPYRVWKNRLRGVTPGVWTNAFSDAVPGESWHYPEFKGFFGLWCWAQFQTADATIMLVNGDDRDFLGVFRPRDGKDPMSTQLFLPETGIAILDAIPAIGNKFMPPEKLGPQSQPAALSGLQRGAVWLRIVPAGP